MTKRSKGCVYPLESIQKCAETYIAKLTVPKQEWKYDNFGELRQSTDGRGNLTEYTYDGLGRLRTTTYPDGKTQTVEYDNTTHRQTTVVEPHDNLSVNPSKARRSRYHYDGLGRLVREERLTSPGIWPPVSSVTYDTLNHIASETDARGNVTEYTYDVVRCPTGITYPDAKVTRYRYDDGARKQVITDTNGNETDQTFDVFGRLIEVVQRPDLGTAITTTHSYDDAGNQTSTSINGQLLYGYEYGIGNRLTKFRYPTGTLADVEYTYWNSGELHQRIVGSVWAKQTVDEAGRK